jgi:hypothetical protein
MKPGCMVMKWHLFQNEAKQGRIADTEIDVCAGSHQYYIEFWLCSAEVVCHIK